MLMNIMKFARDTKLARYSEDFDGTLSRYRGNGSSGEEVRCLAYKGNFVLELSSSPSRSITLWLYHG